MRGFLVLFLLAQLLSGCVTMTQIRLDAEVDRRCREDGGLKVYETVPTPPEMFNQYGRPTFFDITKHEDALGADYKFIYKETFYHGGYVPFYKDQMRLGSPSMRQIHIQVVRRSDGKLLGESIDYSRYGGDPAWAKSLAPGAPETSYSCPEKEIGENTLIKRIFIPTTKRGVRP